MPPEDAPRIYLDHNAIAPLEAEARAAMLPAILERVRSLAPVA